MKRVVARAVAVLLLSGLAAVGCNRPAVPEKKNTEAPVEKQEKAAPSDKAGGEPKAAAEPAPAAGPNEVALHVAGMT
jgi:hypothetical protein